MLSLYADHLGALERQHRRRSLIPRKGLDFSSNDYLAMARDPRLRDAIRAALDRGVPAGSGGSRLLRGNDPEHEALEAEAAEAFGSEAALFLSSDNAKYITGTIFNVDGGSELGDAGGNAIPG